MANGKPSETLKNTGSQLEPEPSTGTMSVPPEPRPTVSMEPTNQAIMDKLQEHFGEKAALPAILQTLSDMTQQPGHGDILRAFEDLVYSINRQVKATRWFPYPRFEPGHNVACIIRRVNGALRLASLQDAPHPFWKDIVTGATVKSGVTHWCAIPVFQADQILEDDAEFPDTTVEGEIDAGKASVARGVPASQIDSLDVHKVTQSAAEREL